MSAETMTSRSPDPVKQFSIFTENKLGRLQNLIGLLHRNSIHVMALTTLDTTDSAIVRVVVDDPERARAVLTENDFPFAERHILAVEMDSEMGLNEVLSAVVIAEVNIYYVYSFLVRPRGKSAVALNVEDRDLAGEVFRQKGIRMLEQRDISR